MISKEEINKLAGLARIETNDEEQGKLASEIDAILEYVKQINEITEKAEKLENPPLVVRGGQGGVINVMREDENPNETGEFSKELIAEFPDKEGDYLKVKKIL